MKAFFLALMVFCSSAYADDRWEGNFILLDETENAELFFNPLTYEKSNDEESLIVKQYTKKTNKTHFFKVSVKISDCKKRYGKVTFKTLNGEFVTDFDYVYKSGDGSAVSSLGDGICYMVNKDK